MAIGDYTKTTYNNGAAPGISADTLNNNENKTEELDTAIETHLADLVTDVDGVHGLDIDSGEWSPVIVGSTTAGTLSYASSRFGRYRKINDKVFIWGMIINNGSGHTTIPAGYLQIGGLPFVNGAKTVPITLGTINRYDFPANTIQVIAEMVASEAKINLVAVMDNGDAVQIDAAQGNYTNIKALVFSGSYLTTY